MTEETKDEDLKLTEQQDGSVLVGEPPAEKPEAKESAPEDSDEGDDRPAKADDEASHDDEQGAEGETAEDAEARRERNRARRAENKERRKDYIESLKRQIESRDELLNTAMQRLDAVERRTNGADMALVDAELQKAADAYNYYKAVHADAVTNAKGQEAVEAQEKMFAAMQRAQQLDQIKKASKRQPEASAPLDPRLKMHAESWVARNNWYDPDLRDTDSRIANTIDKDMAAEGWNPTTEQYWKELDSRLKKYLPHRYNVGYNAQQSGAGTPRPRAPVAGSGREGSATQPGGYKLSAERVQALKDAGMWDDPVARAQAVKRYQAYDKQGAQ